MLNQFELAVSALSESVEPHGRRGADKSFRRMSRAYGDTLRVADAAGAERVARQGLSEGLSVAGLYQRVIAPAMWRIGTLWEEGKISVADEHLATALTHQVMAGIYGPSLGHKVMPGRVLLAAVEGEQHALGLRMAADVIELAGYETIYLGADVPTVDLLGVVKARAPDLVALAATMPDSATALDRAITGIQGADPSLVVFFGGQGARRRQNDGEAVLIQSLEQLPAAVRRALDARESGSGTQTEPGGTLPGRPTRQGSSGETEPALGGSREEGSLEQNLSGIAAETADLARLLARQANAYKDLAYTDELSGLPNRRAFEDRAVCLRDFSDAKPLAVLMLDLDGFKPVNDSQGHEAGDRVLALIARTIADGLREGDFVARLGGDEFAALLPRTGAAEAKLLAERLREGVEDAGSGDSVTASIGVAMLEDDVRRALLQADVALYEAKNAGRNTVRCG